jgi:hypothetical protein
MQIEISHSDALDFRCDVLVLKHAQALYGVDEAVVQRLVATGSDIASGLTQG